MISARMWAEIMRTKQKCDRSFLWASPSVPRRVVPYERIIAGGLGGSSQRKASVMDRGCLFSCDSTTSHAHHRAAQTKTTLSFQNLEAALPLGIPAARRSNSRSSVRYVPELATIGSIPAGCGRSAWRDREVWMQSEPRRPRIILDVYPRPPGEEGAPDRDSFMRTGRTCMSTQETPFPSTSRTSARSPCIFARACPSAEAALSSWSIPSRPL